MAKRTTRQTLIDMCRSNDSEIERIKARCEAILGTYLEDAPEHSVKAAGVLKAVELVEDVLKKFTLYVRGV